jgi:hypothetical protein
MTRGGEKGSPAYYQGRFSANDATCDLFADAPQVHHASLGTTERATREN